MALPEQPGTSRRRPTLAPWLLVLVLVLGLALLAGGCGSDDDEASDTTAAATTGPGAPATVPDVEGAELTGAAEQLAEAGLRAAVKYVPSSDPAGRVIGQSREAGTELQRGEAVSLNVSTGPSPAVIVTVPDATEQTEADGRAALEQVGFEVQTINVPAVTEDIVVSQSPAAADRVPRGSLVLLYAGGS
jgi:eukaryotic-like serine/threonine-protein kinase